MRLLIAQSILPYDCKFLLMLDHDLSTGLVESGNSSICSGYHLF